MALVLCSFRGDHMTNNNRPHGPNQCPPPRGKRGDRGHSLYAQKARMMGEIKFDDRGASVTGVGGSKVAGNRNKKKAAGTKA